MPRFFVVIFLTSISPLLWGWDTAEAAPPRVRSATPDNGATGVDPSTREIKIVFDQAMSPAGMSVVGGGESYPELRGKPRWKGSRTFVIPVRLKPNHEYWLSINSDRFTKFRNRQGESAVPYPIAFTTSSGGDSQERNAPDTTANAEAYDLLKEAILTQYSHRDKTGVDWERAFSKVREQLVGANSVQDFVRTAAVMLARAEDKHLWLQVDGQTVPTYRHPVTPNINPRVLSKVVPNAEKVSPTVVAGRWDDGIVYLMIRGWSGSQAEALEPIYRVLGENQDAPGVILDVRLNGGGAEPLAREVAGCFVEAPVVYAKHVIVDPDSPGGFSAARERVLEPNNARPAYRGPVAVLTGPAVISSCEAFLLMMKQAPDAVLVGAVSQGSSGNPQPFELGNGVVALVPCWKALTPEGEAIEGVGIAPDIEVRTSRESFTSGDPVIEAALRHLREG